MMHVFDFARCVFAGKHRPDRRYVWHDGQTFRGTCRGCKRDIIREENGWAVRHADPDEAQCH